jgi:hypothetical protein
MRRLAALLFVTLAASTAFAQVNDTYVIPAAGNKPGDFGTRWQTQFSLFNPQTYALRISVTLLPTGGGQGLTTTFRVPANAVAHSDNLLSELFHYTGGGALLVATFPEDNPGVPNDVISRAFLVTSSTYNNTNNGTFGQTIPATWAGLQDYDSDGISAIAHGIRNINREGWRTNIGAVNLGRTSVVMRVTVYDYDGNTILRNAPFSVPAMGHIQDRLPVEVDRGAIEFFVDDPTLDAVVFPYTSTIDQLSGDPTYQTPTLLASPSILFDKKSAATEAAIATPTSIGKKITTAEARVVRTKAKSLGESRAMNYKKFAGRRAPIGVD